jgi:6-phosphogluconolactonase
VTRGEALAVPFDVWCGSYGAFPKGVGNGIGALRVEAAGHLRWRGLAAAADHPSFLARHPSLPIVYAVGGQSEGVLRQYQGRDSGHLEPVGEAWPTGRYPSHVAIDPQGKYLVVACCGDGQVLLYELDTAGIIIDRLPAAAAADPYEGDERRSRAHAAQFLPDGRVATTDLGFDLLRVWRYQSGVGLTTDHEVAFPRGSEPRHLALHPSGRIYVVGEVSVRVFVLAEVDDGRFTVIDSVPATRGGAQDGDSASEISIDSAGRFVHVGVRGSNRIATLAILDEGARLEPLDDVDCGGDHPRHHLQRGNLLLVANQYSGSVAAFRLDEKTGIPVELIHVLDVNSPTCLVSTT